jgi:hypothetical protein
MADLLRGEAHLLESRFKDQENRRMPRFIFTKKEML